jgi:hypothetical protein
MSSFLRHLAATHAATIAPVKGTAESTKMAAAESESSSAYRLDSEAVAPVAPVSTSALKAPRDA